MAKISIMRLLTQNAGECDVRKDAAYNDLNLQEYLNLYYTFHMENPDQDAPVLDQIVNHIFGLIDALDQVSISTLMIYNKSDAIYRGIEDMYHEQTTILFRRYPYRQMLIYPYLSNREIVSKL